MSAFSKLISLPLTGSKKHNDVKRALSKKSKRNSENRKAPIELVIDVESPPCVLYGSANESTGCLLSGLLTVKIKDVLSSKDHSESKIKSQDIKSIQLSFVQRVNYKKPFLQGPASVLNCGDCSSYKKIMKSWTIVDKRTTLTSSSSHIFPFSYLIPGNTPVRCALGSHSDTDIRYELVASVRYYETNKDVKSKDSSSKLLTLKLPILLTRSILRGPDKNSLRVFPPTKLTAAAVIPNVVYPKSTFPLEMKLEGISGEGTRWRMRKMSYRIEETVRVRNHVCQKHVDDLKVLENTVRQNEAQKAKKPQNPIKRYGDLAPQVRLSVNKVATSATNNNQQTHYTLNTPQSVARNAGDRDEEDEENENSSTFVHPSDDVARQEILQQRQRLRKEQIEQEMKNETSLFTEEVRIISEGVVKSGWKTDFSESGKIEIITDIDCSRLDSGVSSSVSHASSDFSESELPKSNPINVACDIQDPVLGVNVSHILSVEIVVAEEALQYPNGQPIKTSSSNQATIDNLNKNCNADQRLAELSPMLANRNSTRRKNLASTALAKVASRNSINDKKDDISDSTSGANSSSKIVGIPTGAARVLRMQFRINVTERSGLGISWDEEVPPIYQNVSFVSPPTYDNLIKDSKQEQSFEGNEYSETPLTPLSNTIDNFPSLEQPVQIFERRTHNTLSPVVSQPMESVESIDGSEPIFHNPLTPRQTREVRLSTLSEILNTDTITQ